METTVVITLSNHDQYEGFGMPETIIFERTSRENGEEFSLRIFRNLIRHPIFKTVRSHDRFGMKLFVSLNVNLEKWKIEMERKSLQKLFATTRIPLLENRIY